MSRILPVGIRAKFANVGSTLAELAPKLFELGLSSVDVGTEFLAFGQSPAAWSNLAWPPTCLCGLDRSSPALGELGADSANSWAAWINRGAVLTTLGRVRPGLGRVVASYD